MTQVINQPDIIMPRQKYYKIFTAKLTQIGTDAPVIQVIQNNTELQITSSREDVGTYNLHTSTSFNTDETTVMLPTLRNGTARIGLTDSSTIYIETYNNSNALADYVLNADVIELKFYSQKTYLPST